MDITFIITMIGIISIAWTIVGLIILVFYGEAVGEENINRNVVGILLFPFMAFIAFSVLTTLILGVLVILFLILAYPIVSLKFYLFNKQKLSFQDYVDLFLKA